MAGIKAGLCVFVIAMSMSSGGLQAADGLHGEVVGNSTGSVGGLVGVKPMNTTDSTIGGNKLEPTPKRSLDKILRVCIALETDLSECIELLDTNDP